MGQSALTVKELLEKARGALELEVLAGESLGRQPITTSDVNRPGLALVGFLDNFLWERILIFGQTEIMYLHTLTAEGRRAALAPRCWTPPSRVWWAVSWAVPGCWPRAPSQ